MKLKTIIFSLFACCATHALAQAPAVEEKAKEKEAPAIKADTPVEAKALKFFELLGQLPDIIGSIKDQATLDAAETKMADLSKKMKAETAELQKLPVPDNAARQKLADKMKGQEKAMEKKMQGAMGNMFNLDPELATGVGMLMQGFGKTMQEISPTLQKYFEPDTNSESGSSTEDTPAEKAEATESAE